MTATNAERTLRNTKIALVVLVVSGLIAAERTGVLEAFGEPAELRRFLVAQGGWGQLAFVVAYALLQPFGVPGTVFVFVAPLLWPWPVAFALTMAGTMGASVVGFSFARFVARDWITPRIPARFHRYDEALAKRGFVTVVILRFIFWMPQALHAFFGVSRVPFWTHFWGSIVGYAVPLLLMAYFGEQVWSLLDDITGPTWLAIALAAVGALGATAFVVTWRRRQRPS